MVTTTSVPSWWPSALSPCMRSHCDPSRNLLSLSNRAHRVAGTLCLRDCSTGFSADHNRENGRGPLLDRSHAVPSTRRTTARNGQRRKTAVESIEPFAFDFATAFPSRLA
jgi:hypothetical protein